MLLLFLYQQRSPEVKRESKQRRRRIVRGPALSVLFTDQEEESFSVVWPARLGIVGDTRDLQLSPDTLARTEPIVEPDRFEETVEDTIMNDAEGLMTNELNDTVKQTLAAAEAFGEREVPEPNDPAERDRRAKLLDNERARIKRML